MAGGGGGAAEREGRAERSGEMLGEGTGTKLSEGGDGAGCGAGGTSGGGDAGGSAGGGIAWRGASKAAMIRGSVDVATSGGGEVPSVGSFASTMRIRTAKAVTHPEAAMMRIWAVEKPSAWGVAGPWAALGAAPPVGPVAPLSCASDSD